MLSVGLMPPGCRWLQQNYDKWEKGWLLLCIRLIRNQTDKTVQRSHTLFSDYTASGARSSAQEGTGIGSVGVYMLLILPEVLKSAVKISSWAKERKIQISISMESRASCELSHSTNIQWISMRNSPLQDVLWSESAFIWKLGEKMARRKGGFGVSGTIDFPLLFWNCFHPIIRPSPRLGTNIAPHLRTEEQMWEKKQ